MTDLNAVKINVNHRHTTLLTGLAEAQKVSGVEVEGLVNFEQTEQADARRELLRIEKQAIRDKELNQKSEQAYINGIRDLVHATLLERLRERLADHEDLFTKVLGYDTGLTPLLDNLSIRAATITRLEPLAADVPWLFDELLKLVNMPKYRRTDAKGKAHTVETLRAALSFIGIDNLRLVVPSLAYRRWIPQITDPYPEVKSKFWEYATATALSCKRIAEATKQDPGSAFAMGMFHTIGNIVVTRLYFRLFDQVQREALIEAHNEMKREEHAALTRITPSGAFLVQLLEEYGLSVSVSLFERMEFKRLFLAKPMKEVAEKLPITHMSPQAQVLCQGMAYARYRMLKGYGLIELEEAKDYLRQFRMQAGVLSQLKSTDLRQLNLKMGEE